MAKSKVETKAPAVQTKSESILSRAIKGPGSQFSRIIKGGGTPRVKDVVVDLTDEDRKSLGVDAKKVVITASFS